MQHIHTSSLCPLRPFLLADGHALLLHATCSSRKSLHIGKVTMEAKELPKDSRRGEFMQCCRDAETTSAIPLLLLTVSLNTSKRGIPSASPWLRELATGDTVCTSSASASSPCSFSVGPLPACLHCFMNSDKHPSNIDAAVLNHTLFLLLGVAESTVKETDT